MQTKSTISALSIIKKVWASIGFLGLIAIILFGQLIYMNLRPADPLLPGWEEYSAERFEALQDRGEPILVEVYASWCPTCLAQHNAFEALIEEGRQPNVRAIRVDFDRDEDFRTKIEINYTGALILYKGKREVARAAGLTSPDSIANFLASHGIGTVK